MGANRARQQPRWAHESGVALVSVIALTAVLTLVAVVAISVGLNAQRFSRDHQDWNAALAAAEAGVDDYLARLNRDREYWAQAAGDTDPDTGLNLNPAIDRWAQLPDSDAWYHYSVDDSEVVETGTLILTVTGRVDDRTRTVQVRLRPEAFFDFLYLTNYEIMDPTISGPSDHTRCERLWGATPAKDPGCRQLVFGDGDVLRGRVHSNDALLIHSTQSPQFLGETTTSFNTDGGYWRSNVGYQPPSATGSIFRPNEPSYLQEQGFPDTNANMLRDAHEHGCVYYGPTYIHFHGDRMTVMSPLSTDDAHLPTPEPGEDLFATTTDCAGGDRANLAGFTELDFIPPVIYVANAGTCPAPFNNTNNHPLGISYQEELISDVISNPSTVNSDAYECRLGDAFVWGELDGRVSLGARNNISVIWDLIYQGGEWEDGTNILGLIADNYVQIRQPRFSSGTNRNRPVAWEAPFPTGEPSWSFDGDTFDSVSDGDLFRNPTVHGAILSLNRSFRVQNYNSGGLRGTGPGQFGTLTLRGSLGQNFRGPVGWVGNHGFTRDYEYDDRLRFISPPFFIDPVEAQFIVTAWSEVREPAGLPAFPNPPPPPPPGP